MKRFLPLILIVLLTIVSCGSEPSSPGSSTGGGGVSKGFWVNEQCYPTLAEAVAALQNANKASKSVYKTITMVGNHDDSGVEIPQDMPEGIILDIGNYVYTLTNSQTGIRAGESGGGLKFTGNGRMVFGTGNAVDSFISSGVETVIDGVTIEASSSGKKAIDVSGAEITVMGSSKIIGDLSAADNSDVSFEGASAIEGKLDVSKSKLSMNSSDDSSKVELKVENATVDLKSTIKLEKFETPSEFDDSEIALTGSVVASDYETMGSFNRKLADFATTIAKVEDKTGSSGIHMHSWKVTPGGSSKSAKWDDFCTVTWGEYWTCDTCGEYHSDHKKTVSNNKHSMVKTPALPATCTESGYDEYYTCSVCGYSTRRETRPLGHSYKLKNSVAATATTAGYSVYECERCHVSYKADFVPATGYLFDYSSDYNPDWVWSADNSSATAIFVSTNDSNYTESVVATLNRSVLKKPGCETVGQDKITASVVFKGKTYKNTVTVNTDALGHKEVQYAAKAPSCTEAGWNEFIVCERCGYNNFEANRVPAKEHNYVATGTVVEATTEHYGYTEYECDQCHVKNERDIVPALSHEFSYTEASFWEWNSDFTGAKAYFKCETCEAEGKTHYVVKDAEVASALTINPSCSNAGLRTFTATFAVEPPYNVVSVRTRIVPMTGHTFIEEVSDDYLLSEATCTRPAEYYSHCSVCDTKGPRFAHGEANGHSFDQEIKAGRYLKKQATCTEAGEYYKSCSVCGEKGTEIFTVDALGHAWTVNKVVNPTADSAGYTEYVCSRCNATKNDDYTSALQYSDSPEWHWAEGYGSATAYFTCLTDSSYNKEISAHISLVAVPASCTREGLKTYTATVRFNGQQYKDEKKDTIAKTEHDYSGKISSAKYLVSPATCTDGAKYYFSCSVCGEKGTETFATTAPGHNMTKHYAVAATCTKDGSVEYYSCSRCNKLYLDKEGNNETTSDAIVIKAPGHDTEGVQWATNNPESHFHICKTCGIHVDETVHTFGEWIDNGTSDRTRTCSECGRIEKHIHTWDEGTVTIEPTQTSEGLKTYHCSECDATKTEKIEKLPVTESDSGFTPVYVDRRINGRLTAEVDKNTGVATLTLSSSNNNTDWDSAIIRWYVDYRLVKALNGKAGAVFEYSITDNIRHTVVCRFENSHGRGDDAIEIFR